MIDVAQLSQNIRLILKVCFIIEKTNGVAEDFASILLCIVTTVKGDSQGPFLADTYIPG